MLSQPSTRGEVDRLSFGVLPRFDYNSLMASVTLERAALQKRFSRRATVLWLAGVGVCIVAMLLWRWTGRAVHVRVDGQVETVVTHRAKVEICCSI